MNTSIISITQKSYLLIYLFQEILIQRLASKSIQIELIDMDQLNSEADKTLNKEKKRYSKSKNYYQSL